MITYKVFPLCEEGDNVALHGARVCQTGNGAVSRVLVVGVELVDQPSLSRQINEELASSKDWKVSQMWMSQQKPYIPKFTAVNQLLTGLSSLDDFKYILVCDDDVKLPPNFLDTYLAIVDCHNFALAQPARTHTSHIHHHIVEQVEGLEARQTQFVEIGPVFSIRRDVVPELLPFDEISPMGWGYEFVWAWRLIGLYRAMGIVDATPVEHALRPPCQYNGAHEQMAELLARNPHISREDAYTVIREYAL